MGCNLDPDEALSPAQVMNSRPPSSRRIKHAPSSLLRCICDCKCPLCSVLWLLQRTFASLSVAESVQIEHNAPVLKCVVVFMAAGAAHYLQHIKNVCHVLRIKIPKSSISLAADGFAHAVKARCVLTFHACTRVICVDRLRPSLVRCVALAVDTYYQKAQI